MARNIQRPCRGNSESIPQHKTAIGKRLSIEDSPARQGAGAGHIRAVGIFFKT